jgi:hypothetical protein
MPPTCPARKEAAAFLSSVGLDAGPDGLDVRLSGTHDRCYCETCYKAGWRDTITNDGPTPCVIPRGWFCFSLALHVAAFGTPHHEKVPDFDEATLFNEWSVSFHGVKDLDTLCGKRRHSKARQAYKARRLTACPLHHEKHQMRWPPRQGRLHIADCEVRRAKILRGAAAVRRREDGCVHGFMLR